MDKWTVGPTPTQSSAYLGTSEAFHTFRFNPDDVTWSYKENIISRDTLGGRVVQLLSVQVENMTVNGRAGSRGELQRLAANVKDIMHYQIKTLRPVSFKVPSRKWNFLVYVAALPQVGWEVASTSYPYSLQLAIEEDLTGIKTHQLEITALERLKSGIGYNKDVHGGDAQKAFDILSTLSETWKGIGGEWGGDGSDTLPPGEPYDGKGTDAIKEIISIIKAMPGLSYGGLCATSGHVANSEHYYCNAIDVFGSESVLDRAFSSLLAACKRGELPASCLIYERYSYSRSSNWVKHDYSGASTHDSHIHISGWPPK